MASATLVEEGGGGARVKNRWNKVYTRKKKLKNGSSTVQLSKFIDSPEEQNVSVQVSENQVNLNLRLMVKQEIWEFRRKLFDELKQVRGLMRQVEVKELEVNGCVDVDIGVVGVVASVGVDGSSSADVVDDEGELSLTDCDANVVTDANMVVGNVDGARGVPEEVVLDSVYHTNLANGDGGVIRAISDDTTRVISDGNSVGKHGECLDKEKRTPKANQYYRNSEFIVGNEKFPNKKSKTSGSKKLGGVEGRDSGFELIKHTSQVFKNCSSILTRLMKHKHGWVFNVPVDVEALQLHDYFLIIKHPMDLGTVNTRLNENWYRSPREFAEDVRLTFHNAMTYNPKGHDVHVMAEQLSQIFEDRWAGMETRYNLDSWTKVYNDVSPHTSTMKRAPHMPLETDRNPNSMHLTPEPVKMRHLNRGRSGRTLKKPKARDHNKRDMTFEEKQKLSKNLETLPSEKLDSVVEIIKRRNSALLQQEDAIEVDIDSVDAETLWDLDRLVTNYKKTLSKHKRKRELAIQASEYAHPNAQGKNQAPAMVQVSKESQIDEGRMGLPPSLQEDKQQDSSSRSSSSSSSSSRSGSSSDSDGDGSSGSDTRHSPRD